MTRSAAAWWKANYEGRHAWAFSAYDAFMASLSPEVRERLVQKKEQDEAYVVVFGKTQVGKTTLLMDLMGVSPSVMARVSEVLRGGRPEGRSATATAMEYRCSPDMRWGLRKEQSTRWFETDSDMTCAIAELRHAMEGQCLVLKQPCVVHIPQNCFDARDGQSLVRMLDLPGDKPANDVEQDHVHEMARRYVPLADLILLVGRGDDLSFLQPGGLTLPGIEDWQSVPSRFRIVTTYSFTAESVRELVWGQTGALSIELFRERLIEQIEKSGSLSDQARQPQRFFSLEFGQSWSGAKRRRPGLYERLSPIIDEQKQQLHADIHASTAPLARLKGAVHAHVAVAWLKKTRLTQMQEEVDDLAQRLAKARDECIQAERAVRQSSSKLQALDVHLAHLVGGKLKRDLDKGFQLVGDAPPAGPGKSVADFRLVITLVRRSFIRRATDSRPRIEALGETRDDALLTRERFWAKLQLGDHKSEILGILEEAFSWFECRLNKYAMDSYWPNLSKDYSDDLERLTRCLADAEEQLLNAARQWWLEEAQKSIAKMRGDRRTLKQRVANFESLAGELRGRTDKIAMQHLSSQQRCLMFEQRMDKDLVESQRFHRLLDENYLTELQQRRQEVVHGSCPSRRLIALLGAVQLSDTRRKLMQVTEGCSA